ncbi:MAG: hypothetical protein JXA11_13050 [Phycisphaerae bacterium]|nr:hypothetical protein [Phycisphaerae bacterium]
MNFRMFKGQVLILLSGLYFILGILLVLSNARNEGALWWFAKNMQANMSLVMIISAAVGMAAIFVFKLLLRGVKDLRIGRLQASLQRVEKIEKNQTAKQPPKETS